ncbi:hypothetical protein [Kineococcus gypseus]|uniref:hypothetical protein n=1 Tax=Kineococcus gypseus TaxID=1637102 RepID=UPI003D7DFC4F
MSAPGVEPQVLPKVLPKALPRPPDGAAPRRARRTSAFGGWALTVATAAPLVLVLEVARRFLSGESDEVFGLGGGPGDGLPREPGGLELLAERWALLWQWQAPHTTLLASALGAVVLAAVAVAGRPAPLVPRAGARWAATAVAVAVALASLVALAGFAAVATDLLPPTQWLAVSTFLALGPQAGVVVLAGALAATAAWALLRAPAGALDDDAADPDDADDAGDETEGEGHGDGRPAGARAAADTADTAASARGAAGSAAERAGDAGASPDLPADDGAAAGPPRVRAEELALYRRPS